jgi:hypothetical protein
MAIDIHYYMSGHSEPLCVVRNTSAVPRVDDDIVLPWLDDEPDEAGYAGPWVALVMDVEWRIDKRETLDTGNDVVFVTLDEHPILAYCEVARL